MKPSRPWQLQDFSLSQAQRAFLENHYSVPTDADVEGMPPRARKRFVERLECSSPLAAMRLQQEDWRKEDQRLFRKALRGDDKAFLELVGRDPRYVCSDLGLYFISRWQNLLDMQEVLHTKPSPETTAFFEAVRNYIRGISSMLLRPFDARGKHKAYRSRGAVKCMYYAALILFHGIKQISRNKFRNRAETVKWIDKFRQEITNASEDEVMANATEETRGYSFFLVIQQVDSAIKSLGGELSKNFNSDQIVTMPAHQLAKELVMHYFGIRGRTIDVAVASDEVISWPLPDGSVQGFASKPFGDFRRLVSYPPIRKR